MQGFVLNLRRETFARIRSSDRALNYAFDFEEMNKQLFYNLYQRIGSYFSGTDLAGNRPARGTGAANSGDGSRQGAARSLHQGLCQSGEGQSRRGAQQSARERRGLSVEAGFQVKDQKLVDPKGQAGHNGIARQGVRPTSACCCFSNPRWSASVSQ